MHEVHLRQPGLTCRACKPFTKSKERILKLKETADSKYFYQNKLEKACFQHNMAYEEFKNLLRGKASDKVFLDKAFNVAETQNVMNINVNLLQWFITFPVKCLLVLIFRWSYCTSK